MLSVLRLVAGVTMFACSETPSVRQTWSENIWFLISVQSMKRVRHLAGPRMCSLYLPVRIRPLVAAKGSTGPSYIWLNSHQSAIWRWMTKNESEGCLFFSRGISVPMIRSEETRAPQMFINSSVTGWVTLMWRNSSNQFGKFFYCKCVGTRFNKRRFFLTGALFVSIVDKLETQKTKL